MWYHMYHMSYETFEVPKEERISESPVVRAEAETRERRLELMREFVERLFPHDYQLDLRAKIERSFHVPQWGEYHNEGIFMDRHFAAILAALNRIDNGVFPEEIPVEERAEIQDTVQRYREELHKYDFLHDISKADTMRLESLPQEGEKKGIVWEGTLEQFYDELSIPLEARENPVAMARELEDMRAKKVSYMNNQESNPFFGRVTEKVQHGAMGKRVLEALATSGMSQDVLEAIEKHEVAFQFQTGKVDTYAKYFEGLTPEGRRLALVASLVDTMGSLGKNGKPDLKNFLALLAAKHNYELWRSVERFAVERLADGTNLDPKKVEAFLLGIKKTETYIKEPVIQLEVRMLKECKPTVYDMAKVNAALTQALSTGALTADEVELVTQGVLARDLKSVGQKLGKKMATVHALLKPCEM